MPRHTIRVIGAPSGTRTSLRTAEKKIWRREAEWEEHGVSIRILPGNSREHDVFSVSMQKLESQLGYDGFQARLNSEQIFHIPVVMQRKLIETGGKRYSPSALVGRGRARSSPGHSVPLNS